MGKGGGEGDFGLGARAAATGALQLRSLAGPFLEKPFGRILTNPPPGLQNLTLPNHHLTVYHMPQRPMASSEGRADSGFSGAAMILAAGTWLLGTMVLLELGRRVVKARH